ncbi:MAG: MoaD/ThiS family protein [Chloroflexi bacterium]|nr:MoaD/ThiS family protein [Chloroflexota bacterium]
MQLVVEFLGQSRRLANAREVVVRVGDTASYRDVLRQVAADFPALLGPLIVPHSFGLVPSYMLNVDGRRVVSDLDALPEDGQRLIFMFVEAGG